MKKKNIRKQIEFYKRNNFAKKLAASAAGAFAAGLACLALSDRIRSLRKTSEPLVKFPPGGILSEPRPDQGSGYISPGSLDLFGEVSIPGKELPVKWKYEDLPEISNEERLSIPKNQTAIKFPEQIKPIAPGEIIFYTIDGDEITEEL